MKAIIYEKKNKEREREREREREHFTLVSAKLLHALIVSSLSGEVVETYLGSSCSNITLCEFCCMDVCSEPSSVMYKSYER